VLSRRDGCEGDPQLRLPLRKEVLAPCQRRSTPEHYHQERSPFARPLSHLTLYFYLFLTRNLNKRSNSYNITSNKNWEGEMIKKIKNKHPCTFLFVFPFVCSLSDKITTHDTEYVYVKKNFVCWFVYYLSYV